MRSGEFFERGVNVADHVQRAVAQNHAVFTRMLDGKLHAVFDDAASRHGLSEAAQVGGKIGCLHGAGIIRGDGDELFGIGRDVFVHAVVVLVAQNAGENRQIFALQVVVDVLDKRFDALRIVLERLKAAMAVGERLPSQLLLLPEVVDLSLTQKAALAGEFESLAKLGLVLEDFGAGVMVREVPALLKDAAIKKMVADLADEMAEWGATTVVEDKINHIAATMACHGSVLH